jgi:hypothetical protein
MKQATICVSAAGKKSVTGYTPPVRYNAAWHRLPPGVQSRSDVILLVFSEGYIWKGLEWKIITPYLLRTLGCT